MSKLSSLLLTTTFLGLTASPALAHEWRHHDAPRPYPHDEWRERHEDWYWHGDIHRFHEYDYDMWRIGHWTHGYHEGRDGWWWIAGGIWYYYPAPVYPYPDPYVPSLMVVEQAPVTPIGVAPTYVYYCASPNGYYPYIAQCAVPWQKVVAATGTPATVVQPQPAQTVIVQQPTPQPAAQPVVAPTPQAAMPDQRQQDDRQLNAFAVELQKVDVHSAKAASTLRKLEKRVEEFRQSLFQRSYNAMDILKDTEDLKKRIANERASLPKPAPKTP